MAYLTERVSVLLPTCRLRHCHCLSSKGEGTCYHHCCLGDDLCPPQDDRYFLSGSLDGKLRLWNIPDKKVALWNEIEGVG